MLHQEEKSACLSAILNDFFNNFESTEIAENLLFIASDFVESPPNGISQNRANYYLFEMQCLAILLPKLQIAMLQSQFKTA